MILFQPNGVSQPEYLGHTDRRTYLLTDDDDAFHACILVRNTEVFHDTLSIEGPLKRPARSRGRTSFKGPIVRTDVVGGTAASPLPPNCRTDINVNRHRTERQSVHTAGFNGDGRPPGPVHDAVVCSRIRQPAVEIGGFRIRMTGVVRACTS